MKATLSQLLAPLLTLLLAAGVAWWWYANMEKRWEAQVEMSEQAVKNPMLAAIVSVTAPATSNSVLQTALTPLGSWQDVVTNKGSYSVTNQPSNIGFFRVKEL